MGNTQSYYWDKNMVIRKEGDMSRGNRTHRERLTLVSVVSFLGEKEYMERKQV